MPSGHFLAFAFTPKQKTAQLPFGGYQARCPYHRKSDRTDCKRFLHLRSNDPVEKKLTLRRLVWWCCLAPKFELQHDHVRTPLPPDTVPPFDILSAQAREAGLATVPAKRSVPVDADVMAGSQLPFLKAHGLAAGKASEAVRVAPRAQQSAVLSECAILH